MQIRPTFTKCSHKAGNRNFAKMMIKKGFCFGTFSCYVFFQTREALGIHRGGLFYRDILGFRKLLDVKVEWCHWGFKNIICDCMELFERKIGERYCNFWELVGLFFGRGSLGLNRKRGWWYRFFFTKSNRRNRSEMLGKVLTPSNRRIFVIWILVIVWFTSAMSGYFTFSLKQPFFRLVFWSHECLNCIGLTHKINVFFKILQVKHCAFKSKRAFSNNTNYS